MNRTETIVSRPYYLLLLLPCNGLAASETIYCYFGDRCHSYVCSIVNMGKTVGEGIKRISSEWCIGATTVKQKSDLLYVLLHKLLRPFIDMAKSTDAFTANYFTEYIVSDHSKKSMGIKNAPSLIQVRFSEPCKVPGWMFVGGAKTNIESTSLISIKKSNQHLLWEANLICCKGKEEA